MCLCSDPFSPQESSNFLISLPCPKIFPSNRINYFMEWECVYHRPLYCSTPWMKVLVITGVPLMVKCWRILARQFSAPCPAQQQHQQGETQSEERIWPPQKKNGPLILALVSLGLPLGLEQIWFSAERGSFCREGTVVPPSTWMCHNWFQSR